MCIPFETMEATTDKGRQCVFTLKVLAGIEIIIAMLKMFVFQNIMAGFYELLSCLILWMGWAQLSYCICLLYIVYICILGAITYGANLITPIQNGMPFFGTSGLDHACVIFSILFLIFYVVAAYLVFQAYKEFKAMQLDIGGGNGFLSGPSQGGNRGQAAGGAVYSSGQNNGNYGVNQNYGGNGRGDAEAYVPPPPAPSTSTQQSISANNTSRGGQEQKYFQGKGVRIG